jgi:hypothetical protein
VAEVFPGIVVRDEQDRAETVQYHQLIPLLLKQAQDQQREVAALNSSRQGAA